MLKVFLVEDETIIREGLRDIIPWQQYGYILVGDAGDGEQALPMIRETRPDVLITDIKMPFMDGLALSSLVNKELPGTKIIIISGYDDFEYARQAIRIGVEQYLLKPITKATLTATLSEVREKIENERQAEDYLEKFRSEVQEYEQFSRRRFFEQDRIHHVDSCNANTGPIFLACRYTDSLLTLMNNWKDHHEAAYDFTEEDQITHRVWVIDEDEVISEINKEFAGIDSLYIADGHHRAASAVKVGLKRREQNPGYTGEEEFNYFLSVVFPYDQLCILPYNRIVKDLNGLTVKAFLGALKFNFELMLMPGFPCKPVEKHCMGMYVDGQWYHLKAWPDIYEKKDVVGQLDVSILQEKVLRPVLGIEDPRTDQRISFVGGSHKAAELAEIADRTGGVAFVMYPTSMEDLMKIADENKLMPPKSTWFEPKLRSGLFIHKL